MKNGILCYNITKTSAPANIHPFSTWKGLLKCVIYSVCRKWFSPHTSSAP